MGFTFIINDDSDDVDDNNSDNDIDNNRKSGNYVMLTWTCKR